MSHFLHLPWLWLFGALTLGTVVGWLTHLPAMTRWDDRPLHIALGAVAIGALLVIAKMVPARYGYRLELGASLTLVGAIGCFVGWALRDLADFTPPATRHGKTASVAPTGSYLFRDALAGMGAGSVYMRATTGHAGPARVWMAPGPDALAQAPAPGGYTFPTMLPFADATAYRRSQATTGLRRHWTWPTPRPAAANDEPHEPDGVVS